MLSNCDEYTFPYLLIRIYTEESFVYKRLNKFLRETDY